MPVEGAVPDAITNQAAGLGVLIGVAAIVAGYLVSCMVPANHFPRTAGLVTANAIIGSLAYAGVDVAGEMLGWALALSYAAGLVLLGQDRS